MPPAKKAKSPSIAIEAVGIPTSGETRVIKNLDENKYDEGYDSDGEIGPFVDAIVNEPDRDVEDEDVDLPPTMLGENHAATLAPMPPSPASAKRPRTKRKQSTKKKK